MYTHIHIHTYSALLVQTFAKSGQIGTYELHPKRVNLAQVNAARLVVLYIRLWHVTVCYVII